MSDLTPEEEEKLLAEVVRLNSTVFGIILGLIVGLVIFIATNWLVLAGGHVDAQGRVVVGPHLQLLGQFFIGYKVSFWGSLIGFFYGLVTGSIIGTLIAWLYNKIIYIRKL